MQMIPALAMIIRPMILPLLHTMLKVHLMEIECFMKVGCATSTGKMNRQHVRLIGQRRAAGYAGAELALLMLSPMGGGGVSLADFCWCLQSQNKQSKFCTHSAGMSL